MRVNPLLRAALWTCPGEYRREYGESIARDVASRRLGLIASSVDVLYQGVTMRLENAARDFAWATKQLLRTPLFTAVVIATFAVTIGANASVFSVLRAVVLAPLPFPDADRLVALNHLSRGFTSAGWGLPDVMDVAKENRSFAGVVAETPDSGTLTGRGTPRTLHGAIVGVSYFNVLGVHPELGRFFGAADARVGAANSIVISDALWRTALGARNDVLATMLTIGGTRYRVVGVAPPALLNPVPLGGNEAGESVERPDYWLAIDPNSNQRDWERGDMIATAFARLKPGVTQVAANADLARIFSRLARLHAMDEHRSATVSPLSEMVAGPVTATLFASFAAVFCVLMAACANIANLLLSRAAAREREFAIRRAVGASRLRITTQVLAESLLLAACGGLVGIILAALALAAFVHSVPPQFPRVDEISFDVSAVLYTLATVAFCALIAGIAPTLALTRVEIVTALASDGRGAHGGRGSQARFVLAAAEIAISLALVVGAALLVRSFVAFVNVPLGFSPRHVLVVPISYLPPLNAPIEKQLEDVVSFEKRAVAHIRSIPGVENAALASLAPLSPLGGDNLTGIELAGRPVPPGMKDAAPISIAGDDYFSVLRIPLLRGRTFGPHDTYVSRPTIIVSESFARRYFHGESALGKRIEPSLTVNSKPAYRTIVGIVADTRGNLQVPPGPRMYVPMSQEPADDSDSYVLVRVKPGIAGVGNAASRAITSLDPLEPAPQVVPMSSWITAQAGRSLMAMVVLCVLGAVALALAVAGVYAVVSYGVAHRTREFGIRRALGARGNAIVRNVTLRAARLVAIGIAAGLLLASALSRIIVDELYDVSPFDPLIHVAVVMLLAAVTLLAALVPALRATRVDLIVALRYE